MMTIQASLPSFLIPHFINEQANIPTSVLWAYNIAVVSWCQLIIVSLLVLRRPVYNLVHDAVVYNDYEAV